MPKRVLLAVNTKARRGRDARDQALAALRARGHTVTELKTDGAPGALSRAIVEHAGEADLLAVGGGDGTIISAVAGLRQTSSSFFGQDDFRVLPNLTLNVGLRWEYNAPTTDKYNHLATFDPTFPNSTPLPYLRISTPQTPNIYNASKKEFSPRIGFAYQLDGKRTYALEGSIFIAGAAVQWLRDGLKLIATAAETGTLAANSDPEDAVYMVPAFVGLGAPWWEADARAAISGLSFTSTRAHIVRAALEAPRSLVATDSAMRCS